MNNFDIAHSYLINNLKFPKPVPGTEALLKVNDNCYIWPDYFKGEIKNHVYLKEQIKCLDHSNILKL